MVIFDHPVRIQRQLAIFLASHQRRNPDDLDVQRMIRSGSETEALGSLMNSVIKHVTTVARACQLKVSRSKMNQRIPFPVTMKNAVGCAAYTPIRVSQLSE